MTGVDYAANLEVWFQVVFFFRLHQSVFLFSLSLYDGKLSCSVEGYMTDADYADDFDV